MDLSEMRKRRGKLFEDADHILKTAEKEGRKMSPEEEKRWDRTMTEIDDLKKEIERRERMKDIGDELNQRQPVIAGRQDTRPPDGRSWDEVKSFALRRDQSLFEQRAARGGYAREYEELRLGELMRALVMGPRNDHERRALGEGVGSAGGFTVPEIVTARWIDRLRARTVLFQAGAQTVELGAGTVNVAQLTGDVPHTWKGENLEATGGDPTFGQVIFRPETLFLGPTRVSRELMQDSVNIADVLETSITAAAAVEIDRIGLYGTGSGEPLGIANYTNKQDVALGAALTNYDPMINLNQKVHEANETPSPFYIMSPRSLAVLEKLKEATTNAPLMRPPSLQQFQFLQTTAVLNTEGAGTDTRIFGGNFARLFFGTRLSLVIQVLQERYGEFFQVGFIAALRGDWLAEHEESVGNVSGISAT